MHIARRMQEDGRSCDQADMPPKLVGWMAASTNGSAFCLRWANRDTWQTRVDLRQSLGREYGRERLLPSQRVEWLGEKKRRAEFQVPSPNWGGWR